MMEVVREREGEREKVLWIWVLATALLPYSDFVLKRIFLFLYFLTVKWRTLHENHSWKMEVSARMRPYISFSFWTWTQLVDLLISFFCDVEQSELRVAGWREKTCKGPAWLLTTGLGKKAWVFPTLLGTEQRIWTGANLLGKKSARKWNTRSQRLWGAPSTTRACW